MGGGALGQKEKIGERHWASAPVANGNFCCFGRGCRSPVANKQSVMGGVRARPIGCCLPRGYLHDTCHHGQRIGAADNGRRCGHSSPMDLCKLNWCPWRRKGDGCPRHRTPRSAGQNLGNAHNGRRRVIKAQSGINGLTGRHTQLSTSGWRLMGRGGGAPTISALTWTTAYLGEVGHTTAAMQKGPG